MAEWEFYTDEVLDAIRDGLGSTVTVGGVELPWVRKVEGPPLRWLNHPDDYPMVTIELSAARHRSKGGVVEISYPITVHMMLPAENTLGGAPYQELRRAGEGVLRAMLRQGFRLGLDVFSSWELVEHGTNNLLTDVTLDDGLGVYTARLVVLQHAPQVAAS